MRTSYAGETAAACDIASAMLMYDAWERCISLYVVLHGMMGTYRIIHGDAQSAY